jgi:hypothetical protein
LFAKRAKLLGLARRQRNADAFACEKPGQSGAQAHASTNDQRCFVGNGVHTNSPSAHAIYSCLSEIRSSGGDICHALGRKWQSLSIDPALCPHPLSLMLTAVE